ncbi:hypothetical protein CN918_30395 [Priestia megaterium]|nr:hypothetical protein CN918_30395 [Priestia megaterium]
MDIFTKKMSVIDKNFDYQTLLLATGRKFSKKLMENGEDELALKLINRLFSHHQSLGTELEFMGQVNEPINRLGYPSPRTLEAILSHWQENEHHPEYWMDWKYAIEELKMGYPREISSKLSEHPDVIAEMICSWAAEHNGQSILLRQFWEGQAQERWIFNDKTKECIEQFLSYLA